MTPADPFALADLVARILERVVRRRGRGRDIVERTAILRLRDLKWGRTVLQCADDSIRSMRDRNSETVSSRDL